MNEKLQLSMLVTVAGSDRIISAGGVLPWRFSEDDKRFASMIKNRTVIIGRKAFMANVRNLSLAKKKMVLTRDVNFSHEGAIIAYSPEDALEKSREDSGGEVFVIGGGEVFATFLPFVETIYMSIINRDIKGDISLPACHGFEIAAEEEVREARTVITLTELQRKKAA